ncbi:hypothetical protein M3Y98_00757900 [Aphelenchoides besseyi]|nr:hypothetical protein M3Y98_00757900 [Aphelenchoides besseyi]KAI6211620.1 hypothetical protein M3Y96_00453500 [Aphelenchoides besseyi]
MSETSFFDQKSNGSTNKWWIIAGAMWLVDVLIAIGVIVLLINVLSEKKKVKKKQADKKRKVTNELNKPANQNQKPIGVQTDATVSKAQGTKKANDPSKITEKKGTRGVDASIKEIDEANDDEQSSKVVCPTKVVAKDSANANEHVDEDPNKVTESFLFKK